MTKAKLTWIERLYGGYKMDWKEQIFLMTGHVCLFAGSILAIIAMWC